MLIKKEAIEYINRLLALPSSGTEQDWCIEMADSSRINEFISIIRNNVLSNDEKNAVMALILASYDDFLSSQEDNNHAVWLEVSVVIEKDDALYLGLLKYWALEGKDQDDTFNITPLVKAYLVSKGL